VTGVRYGGPDGAGEIRADLTLTCDGRASVLRRASGCPPGPGVARAALDGAHAPAFARP
jgi:2-polyprenyl-6-methoxyphenol hydroxylase-like FAD-dependent oxidoreductase